jgi:hypothetical protein
VKAWSSYAIEFSKGRDDRKFRRRHLIKSAERPQDAKARRCETYCLATELRRAAAGSAAARECALQPLFRCAQEFIEIGRLAAPPWTLAAAIVAAARRARGLSAPRSAHGPASAAFSRIVLPGHSISFPPVAGVDAFSEGGPRRRAKGSPKE